MLKEMTVVLVIALCGSQGMPTPRSREHDRGLVELYCQAEALLREYKSVDDKVLPAQTRPALASVFSQPGCNVTKSAEECQILQVFHKLFLWLQSTYLEDGLLKSVMNSFTFLIQMQERHVSQICLEGASDKVPEITCPKYSNGTPELENKLHYIFELYRNHTHDLWRSTLTKEQKKATDVCGSNN